MIEKLTAADPETRSPDLVAENIEQLKALFPDAFTEGRVDFEVLKQLLGGTVDEREEKYGLNWNGKRRARQLALTPSTGTLRPCPKESVDWDSTQNLMIEGDNLEVLKLLQKSYSGKVKLIYIDPPYNTGKDFVYPDDYGDNIRNYLEITRQVDGDGRRISSNTEASGRYHTNWLNMMYPRIKIARNLLRDDGFIVISIDDNEEANLRQICDEVFGFENLIAIVTWRRKKESSNDGKGFAVKGEYLAVYRKSESAHPNHLPLSDAYLDSSYNNPTDEYPEDRWRPVPITVSKGHQGGGYDYSVQTPTGQSITRTWLYPEDSFLSLVKMGRVYWGKSEDGIPQRVMYAKESGGTLPDNLWIDIATNKEGKNEITDLLGGDYFDTVKPVGLVRHILRVASGPDSIVMDFFAGSGTTGQAAMVQNVADGGHRRTILVQLPEHLDPDNKDQEIASNFCDQLGKPRNIAELTKERLRRAGNRLRQENPMFGGDLGFRVFKLDSSNIESWDPDRDNLPKTLEESVEHLKTDRTENDILFELLLKLGLDLTAPIETKTIAGKTVHSVGAGTLVVCLAEAIGRKDVEAVALGIVDWHRALAPAGESMVVFRDRAFADDVAKTNLAAILQQYGLGNVRSL